MISSFCRRYMASRHRAYSSSLRIQRSERKVVDLRSDTVTQPSPAMLRTALSAPTGDDVLGEDPTVHVLEEYMAELFGKNAALYVPTGTMANLVSIMAHADRRASEVIVGARSHVSLWEGGSAAGLAAVHCRALEEDTNTGELPLLQIQDAIQDNTNDHCATTAAVCLENTHNMLGGVALRQRYLDDVGALCQQHHIGLHIDGARIFNAAAVGAAGAAAVGAAATISNDNKNDLSIASHVRDLCRDADTVSVCFSKGLGSPMGSVVVGSTYLIHLARRARKRCGGGMRQSGVMAAMCLYAVQFNVERLVEDWKHAQMLATKLSSAGFNLPIRQGDIDSNIVYFEVPSDMSEIEPERFSKRLFQEFGVRVSTGYGKGGRLFRAVTHLDIQKEDVERAAVALIDLAHQYRNSRNDHETCRELPTTNV